MFRPQSAPSFSASEKIDSYPFAKIRRLSESLGYLSSYPDFPTASRASEKGFWTLRDKTHDQVRQTSRAL